MEFKESLNRSRLGVIVTLVSLISIISIFEYCKVEKCTNTLKICVIIILIIFIVSFIFTYIKTGLWQFTHKPLVKLDEREILLISKSLRYAYAFFTIMVLSLLLLFSIFEKPIDIVIVASLILFAHLLPASVIAWIEK